MSAHFESEQLREVLRQHAPGLSPARAERIRASFQRSFEATLPLSSLGVQLSGSYAKGTANRDATDLDLLVSMGPVADPLVDLYGRTRDLLRLWFGREAVREQAVSLGLKVEGYAIDVVPARRQSLGGSDHSLWVRRARTWTKTNVARHIHEVRASGRQEEIRVMKRWRTCQEVALSSFATERLTLEALHGVPKGLLSVDVRRSLAYVAERVQTRRLVDPSNSANDILAPVSSAAREYAAANARACLAKASLREVIW